VGVFLVLMDCRPAYLQRRGAASSLLLAPLGTGTLLERLHGCVPRGTVEGLIVLPSFEPDDVYEGLIRGACPAADTIVPASRFGQVLNGLEPSDHLLILDPRCFPVERCAFAKLLDVAGSSGWVKHLVALDGGSAGTKEYVQLDGEGQVDRIQRYYAGLTWLCATGVSCSLVPVAALRLVAQLPFTSLSQLRRGLAAGEVPAQEVPLPGQMIDLEAEHGLLWLTERFVLTATSQPPPEGYKLAVDGVYVGRGCRIDPTARIYGPVVIHDDVTIAANAVVVGPALLGAGSRVGRGAVVAQCLLMPRGGVAAGATVRHRVLCDGAAADCPAQRGGPSALLGVYHSRPPATTGLAAAGAVLRDGLRRRCLYPPVKRLLETALALLSLIALSPLLLITALLVKLTSRGPILFGDEREGKGGGVFRCWKFRTMVRGAHAKQRALYKQNKVDGPQFKLDRDPRVTPLGRLLRATNLDELPQLINVVLGQMSLIGPRPSPFRENQICVPWRQARLSVRPGITGLWQVCRHDRAHGDFHQWIFYDMLYVRHMSFWLDVKILIATLLTLGGRWSVPLTWIIPRRRLYAENQVSVTTTWQPPAPAHESATVPRAALASPAVAG